MPVQPVFRVYLLKAERYANRKHPAVVRLTRLGLHHKASALFTRWRTGDTIVFSAFINIGAPVICLTFYLFRLRSPWFHDQQLLLRIGRHVRLAEKSTGRLVS